MAHQSQGRGVGGSGTRFEILKSTTEDIIFNSNSELNVGPNTKGPKVHLAGT